MRKLLLSVIMLTLLTSLLFAVPARPGFRPFTQPDGTVFIAELRGDEHFHFARTEDGYSIIRDSEGWWTYAQKVDGILVPSAFIVAKDTAPFEKGLHPDAEAVANLPGNELKQINWSKVVDVNDELAKDGFADRRFLVILGCFDDSSFLGTTKPANWNVNPWTLRTGFTSGANGGSAHDSLYWDSVFFSKSPGSFRTFFKEISFGRWIIDTMCHVQGPVSSGKTYAVYGDGKELTYMQDLAYRSSGRMKYGTTRRADQNAYSDYDGDGDGYVDHWIAVRCGGEQSGTGSVKDMWATKYTTTISTTTGATIRNPTNAGELLDSLSKNWTLTQLQDTHFVRSYTMGIGVHAHESFHAFTAPDLYDYGYQGEPADVWSLMDGGSWSGDGVQSGSRPPHPGAMLQYSFRGYPESGDGESGFLPDDWDAYVNTNGRYPVVGLAADSSKLGPRFYMIQNAAFVTAGEWFFVENRCNKGFFESQLPEHGIIISHYDVSQKGTYYNDGPTYTYWVEQRGFDPVVHTTYTSDTIYRDAGQAPYWAGDDYEFTNLTSAGANRNGSTTIFGPYIISVSAPGDTMWFTVDNCTAAATASFAYKAHTVLDNIPGYGNNNGVADADEMFDLTIQLKNVGASGAANSIKLRHSQGLCTIIDSIGSWGTIANNAVATNSTDMFRIKLNPGIPEDTVLFFTLVFGTYNVQFGIRVNGPILTQSFKATSISGSLIDAAAIDVIWGGDLGIDDWIMFVAGTGLGNYGGTGAKKMLYWTLSDNGATLKDSFGYPGANYMMCMDHDALGYIWWSSGDSAWQCDLSSGTPTYQRMKWSNTDYAGTVMKRFRGVTFNSNDSLYGYWQTYGSYEESLIGQRRVLGGTATRFWGVPLLDGTSYGGLWNNGRGIEWDGTAFWSVNIFENLIFRKNAVDFKTFYTTSCKSVLGNYPAYDIAFQGVAGDGTPAVPYTPNNRYYLWSMNMDNSEIVQMEVTNIVLPKMVDLVGTSCTFNDGTNTATLVWKKNAATDYVTKYIVYRSTNPYYYPTSADSVGTTTDSIFVNVVPNTKADYYFKVRAVNYQGYSTNSSDETFVAHNTTATNAVSMSLTQMNNDVVVEWTPANDASGSKWDIMRRAADEESFTKVGSVDAKKGELTSKFKYTDSSIENNGTYTYRLDLVTDGGARVSYNEMKIRFVSTLVFGIAPITPNPVKGDFTIRYSIDRNQETSLKIYSITGQCVSTIVDGNVNPGVYTSKIASDKFSAGTYFAVLKQGGRESKQRITLLK